MTDKEILQETQSVSLGLQWTREAADKARVKKAYLYVHNDDKKITPRYLRGAKTHWKTNKDLIYNREYDVTGTPDDIRAALTYGHIDKEVIETAIELSINASNFQTSKADEYKQEIKERANVKPEKGQGLQDDHDWDTLIWMSKNTKNAVRVSKNTGTPVNAVTGKNRKVVREALKQRYEALEEGWILDVSTMDDHGFGAHKKEIPETGRPVSRYGTSNIKIWTNNLDKYVRAIELIFGPEALLTYSSDIDEVKQQIANVEVGKAKTVSNAVSKTVSKKDLSKVRKPRGSKKIETLGGQSLPSLPTAL
jgi:hypothetical protein